MILIDPLESDSAFRARHAVWASRPYITSARGLEAAAMWVQLVRRAELIEETRTLLVYVDTGTSEDEQATVRARVREFMLATISVLVLPWHPRWQLVPWHSTQTYP